MSSLSTSTCSLADAIQSYLEADDKQSCNLSARLTHVGDQARDEEQRNVLTHVIPSLLVLIKHRPLLPSIDLATAFRALGNLLIDNDDHRQLCLEHSAVPFMVEILQSVLTMSESTSSSAAAAATTTPSAAAEHSSSLGKNLLGCLGNLMCDNLTLEQSVIEAGAVPLIVQAASDQDHTQEYRAMACNAALCMDSPLALVDIIFLPALVASIDLNVMATMVETLVDLVDENGDGLQALQSLQRSWVDDIVALLGSIFGCEIDEIHEIEDDVTIPLDGKIGAALHVTSGLLSRTFKLAKSKSFACMSDASLQTLSSIVQHLCARHSVGTLLSEENSGLAEALGILTGALASVCGDLSGCLRVFGAKATEGIVAAAGLSLDVNKAVRSAGLVSLRNLCLATHQKYAGPKSTTAAGGGGGGGGGAAAAAAVVDVDDARFCENACSVAFSGCKHTNKHLSLSGVAALRQAIGNTRATPFIIKSFLKEEEWDWLLTGFTEESLEAGNKGQCECARLVCLIITTSMDREWWGSMLGLTMERKNNVVRCIRLLGKFKDDTVKSEGLRAQAKLEELGFSMMGDGAESKGT